MVLESFLEEASWNMGFEGWVGVDQAGREEGSILDRGGERPWIPSCLFGWTVGELSKDLELKSDWDQRWKWQGNCTEQWGQKCISKKIKEKNVSPIEERKRIYWHLEQLLCAWHYPKNLLGLTHFNFRGNSIGWVPLLSSCYQWHRGVKSLAHSHAEKKSRSRIQAADNLAPSFLRCFMGIREGGGETIYRSWEMLLLQKEMTEEEI